MGNDTNKYNISNNIPQDIFRAYDIRGIVGESFTPDNIYTIGMAIGSEAIERGEHTIIIGRDGRLSGPELSKALKTGIAATGCNVIDIGAVTTPVLYFATHTLSTKSGVMLTGSHNPPNYNGLKIVLGGETLFEAAITNLHTRIVKNNFKQGQGATSDNQTIINDYITRVVGDIKLARPLKIAIDCGNGIGGLVAPQLFRKLGCEVVELFCEVDGTFPNHHPDPSVEKNLQDLIKAVQVNNVDVGLAFDGDADRVGVVTNKGEIITPDRLLMFFAIDILQRNPKAPIPFDVKCSRHLGEQITKHGGIPLMGQTGHSLVKAKMKETGAPIAGEFSGHIFFKERWYGFDDGIYSAARLVELLAKNTQTCSELFAALPNSVNTPELKLPIADDQKFAFMQRFLTNARFENAKVTTIDGLRADFADGFGLARSSNTTPFIILRFEGDNQAAIKRIQELFRKQLLALDSTLQLPF